MLFTTEELAAHLQQELDDTSAQLAHDNAQGVIEGRIGQPVLLATVTPRLPVEENRRSDPRYPYAWFVTLPGRPVTAVTAVAGAGAWVWDRFDTVYLTTDEPTVTPTYTVGYAAVPADIKAVALAVAGRVYSNPVAAVAAESIDDYRVQYADTATGSSEELTDLEQKILDRYRPRVAVIGMR